LRYAERERERVRTAWFCVIVKAIVVLHGGFMKVAAVLCATTEREP
jgi:hypothetical protein